MSIRLILPSCDPWRTDAVVAVRHEYDDEGGITHAAAIVVKVGKHFKVRTYDLGVVR